ncbi:type I-E CRISPR-associated protein Cse2/CasB [Neptunicella sp.]|uniref:type I-E CRISPR-associated protein Cse2/CasB n=1 Tax=Neptunicella sp. TaxID=2125986 RepID=UPI003F68FE4F
MDNIIETVVLRWWQSMFLPTEQLKDKRITPAPSAHKAQLKRAESLDAVMLTAGFRALWLSLPEELIADKSEEKQIELMECFAAIAAALVQVKSNVTDKLATVAGRKTDSDKSTISELRFFQLQNTKTPDDFIRKLRRILQQVKGEVSVEGLAVDIQKWFSEYRGSRPNQASKRIGVEWAMDYYRAASSKAK